LISRYQNLSVILAGVGDLRKTFGPEDVLHYMYAVFHSPTYRTRYVEFLKIDFPRLPLSSNRELFRELCGLGNQLVGLHLMATAVDHITAYPIPGDNIVENVRFTEINGKTEIAASALRRSGQPHRNDGTRHGTVGRVWINKTQYFEGIPEDVWNFHIGGYQVCHKWLKDRKGRTLSYDDMNHYQYIVTALDRTIDLMSEIDRTIEACGGWPIG
jgi:predicted helicase